MCPGPGQARQAVFVLRQLNLQRALAGVRMLGEDVEDQCGAVEHLNVLVLDGFFDLALLARAEFLVEEDRGRVVLGQQIQHLRQLAGTDQGRRIGCADALKCFPDHPHARRFGQLF